MGYINEMQPGITYYLSSTGRNYIKSPFVYSLFFLIFGYKPKNVNLFIRNNLILESYPARLRWFLFGEFKILYWLIGLPVAAIIICYFIFGHFVIKYW